MKSPARGDMLYRDLRASARLWDAARKKGETYRPHVLGERAEAALATMPMPISTSVIKQKSKRKSRGKKDGKRSKF